MKRIQNIMLCVAVTLGFAASLVAQGGSWQRDDLVLNPSGLDLTGATGWVWGDLNGDALVDVVLLKHGGTEDSRLEFWRGRQGAEPPYWMHHPDFFGDLNDGDVIGDLSLADLDGDGQPNLLTYEKREMGWELLYWRQPDENTWEADTTVFAGLFQETTANNIDPSFADIDHDGDPDMLVLEVIESGSQSSAGDFRFFENVGSRETPIWQEDSTRAVPLNDFFVGYNPRSAVLMEVNGDTVMDVLVEAKWEFIPNYFLYAGLEDSTGIGWKFDTHIEVDSPDHGSYKLWNFDVNGDGLQDLLHLEWGGSGRIFLSDTTGPEMFDPDYFRIGALGFRTSNYRPPATIIPFDYNLDNCTELLTAGFFSDTGFMEVVHAYEREQLGFSELWRNTHWFAFAPFRLRPDQKTAFSDLNQNSLIDLVVSGLKAYENPDSNLQASWIRKDNLIARFIRGEPDTLYYDHTFSDLDGDSDHDILITEVITTGTDSGQTRHVFFENKIMGDSVIWSKRPDWKSGLDSTVYDFSTLADLDGDDDADLIFVSENEDLIFYENIGGTASPAWQLGTDIFAGVDVETTNAVALADFDNDGLPDLFLGTETGEVVFYRNDFEVSVDDGEIRPPASFRLFQNYPNPFNPETTIAYEMAEPGHVQLTIYNVRGQRVRTLVDTWQPAGDHQVQWDGRGVNSGAPVASGVYLYELKLGEGTKLRRKMILLR